MNLLHSLAAALAPALLHSVWQLALIAVLASLGFNALAGASARTRHALGMACLLAMLLAPLATFWLYWQPPAAAPAGLAVAGDAAALPSWRDGLMLGLALLWLAGAAAMLLRQLGGWRLLRRIEAQPSSVLPAPWQVRVDALAASLGIARRVSVRLARHVVSPFTTHALRPVVWLPLALLTRLPADQVEALLAHELAHIRRLDWCWNALQCLAEGLLFHHPAMWWLSQRIREEREQACDDLAVQACGDALPLAEALAGLQRAGLQPPALALAARGGGLLQRVERLLAGRRRPADWRATALLLLVAGCTALLAAQWALPAHLLTNLTVDASSRGALAPGQFREVTARYLGEGERHYRVDMAADGQVVERYSEGGTARPVDASVRAWLAAMTAMDASTPRTTPPAPAAVAAAPRPQAPALSDEAARLMAALAADPRLLAVTGQPARLDRPSLRGSVHTRGLPDLGLWGLDDPVGGEARFTARFEGPRGRVEVRYAGRTVTGGRWAAERLDLRPLPS